MKSKIYIHENEINTKTNNKQTDTVIDNVIREHLDYDCDSLMDMLILELFAHVYSCFIFLYSYPLL